MSQEAVGVTGISPDSTPRTSKEWTWGCTDSSACVYRYVITQDTSHTFQQADAYASVEEATQGSGDGIYYLHIQARRGQCCRVECCECARPFGQHESRGDGTGGGDSPGTKQDLELGCADQSACLYRHAISQEQAHTFESTEAFAETAMATRSQGDGTYYLHVQAQDAVGNLSAVSRSSVVLDNTPPSVTGLRDDGTPTRSKDWTWGCDDVHACSYRSVVNRRSLHAFSNEAFSSTSQITHATGDGTFYLPFRPGTMPEISARW